MYEKYPYICIASLIVSLTFTCLSPREALNVNVPLVSAHNIETPPKEAKQEIYESFLSWTGKSWNESNKTKANSWNSTSTGQLQSLHDNPSCNAECKVKTLVKLGMNEKIAGSLVYTCKDKAKNPTNCIIAGASILKAESNLWKKCNGYNCFGMWGGSHKYSSYEKWVEDFVRRYNKYWYKAKSASFFYPSKWGVSPSRYCTSEASSNSSKGCPNWLRTAQQIWDKLEKLF